jgi:hypothetical protein
MSPPSDGRAEPARNTAALKRPHSKRCARTGAQGRAFSLVEMMVTVTLLAFIVLGLTAMFVQTQRAFHAGVTQTDVLEAGRAAMDLMTRELEGATPSRIAGVTNFLTRYEAISDNLLPGTTGRYRTNLLSCCFALVEKNRKWTGLGYVVAFPGKAIGTQRVGSLYRFQYPPEGLSTNDPGDFSYQFYTNAAGAVNNGVVSPRFFNRVADGIIHLRVLAYNDKGILLSSNNAATNMWITEGSSGMMEYTCTNNAVPAYLDLELGVLEARAFERYKAIPVVAAQTNFLQRQAGAIHIFRRRIALHNVDPEAYR